MLVPFHFCYCCRCCCWLLTTKIQTSIRFFFVELHLFFFSVHAVASFFVCLGVLPFIASFIVAILFYTFKGTAYCTGRGEVVTPLAPLPRQGEGSAQTLVWVVKPFVGLSTPQVFKALDLDSRSTVGHTAPFSLFFFSNQGTAPRSTIFSF